MGPPDPSKRFFSRPAEDQRIWVFIDGAPAGGAFVSTTGFVEAVLHIDDDKWHQAVVDAVRLALSRRGELQFSEDPGSKDHFAYRADGCWTNSFLPDEAVPRY